MATAGGSGNTYRFSVYGTETVVGAGCTGDSTFVLNLLWNDPSSANVTTVAFVTYKEPGNFNGVVSSNPAPLILSTTTPIAQNLGLGIIQAKASTNVQYSMTYTQGASCTTPITIKFYPVLEQIQ